MPELLAGDSVAQLKTVEGSKEGKVNGGGGMEGGCLPLNLFRHWSVRTNFPPTPPTFPFSHCLTLIYRCPAEFYSSMRMDLFSCDYFVAVV